MGMSLIFDYFRYAWHDLRQMQEVKKRYYKDPVFASIDRSLLRKYLLRSPYRISRHYLKSKKSKELYTYGETPLTTFEKIAKEAEIRPGDRFLELGCGRGRAVLFFAHFYQCQAFGIERIPQFVTRAKSVALEHEVRSAHFECSDIFEAKWPAAHLIYLYGTCLQDEEIAQLVERFKSCPEKPRILSVSYSLLDYDRGDSFVLKKKFPISFVWGQTHAFLQRVK